MEFYYLVVLDNNEVQPLNQAVRSQRIRNSITPRSISLNYTSNNNLTSQTLSATVYNLNFNYEFIILIHLINDYPFNITIINTF